MLKLLLIFGAAAIANSQSGWTSYLAQYKETVTETDKGGHVTIHNENTGEESRTVDGSLLTTTTINGVRVSGKLWQACGQVVNLNYSSKRAVFTSVHPRKHPFAPPDAPLGTVTIGDLQFTGYPVHMEPGTGSGTIWVNQNDDIQGKLEMHLNTSNGGHRDIVRQLTALDLTSPIDDSVMTVPNGFATTHSSKTPANCGSSAAVR